MARALHHFSRFACRLAPGATDACGYIERGFSKVIRTILCALVGWAAFAAHAHAADPFPRLGGIFISDPRNYEDASYQEAISKLDLAIMSVYPGWEQEHGTTMEAVAKRIKTLNPDIRIFLYFIPESRKLPMNGGWADLGTKLDGQRWWGYQSGGSGTKVLSDFGNETYVVNLTNFAPADSSGKRSNQWIAQYAVDKLIASTPSVDGLFTDNMFWKPRVNADWNRDGQADSQDDTAVQKYYREGNRTYLNALKALMPGKLQIANIADWGKAASTITEYDQLLPGGVMNVVGKSYSVESWAGWPALLNHYRKSMQALAPPKLGMFSQSGEPSDYQSMRYGLATSLLDDAYYAFHDLDGFSGVPWFDEFDVSLGQATTAPPTAAWQNGVWRRDFEGGIALVNPKGNGAKEITLEKDYRKISGNQDRAVNNGETVRKVTLRDRDGIILLRMQRRPRAPSGVRINPQG